MGLVATDVVVKTTCISMYQDSVKHLINSYFFFPSSLFTSANRSEYFDLADSYTYTVTCEEDEPGFCGSGLRELSKAGGLMRRVARPPCRGCNGVGRSSFSNTEENSSPRTFKVKENRWLINNRKEVSTGKFTTRKSPKTGSKTAVYSFALPIYITLRKTEESRRL